MYKVNCKKSNALQALKQILISDEILFRFDVSKKANVTVLTVEKETQMSEYSVYGSNQLVKITKFLQELKNILPTYLQEDVNFVIEEAEEAFSYANNY